MDKKAIKKYAIWARRELIERVSQRAMMYGITENDAGDSNADSIDGHLLTQTEKRQRQALIRKIKGKGYEQVMEEVAYTWFNRFAALRFMEVNGYLPSHIRVFTNDAGEFKPQILAEAIHLELDGLDMNIVYELESTNKIEELFKYLLIVQCNDLNGILPGMFQKIDDYTELLLPDYLLREGSVIEQMVTTIPEEDWTDQVQIIGWLYQYYNTEPKDKVFADLKKNIKITKENIPAATQLFTPDWIVHYMVENSLGRLWLEGHPNDDLKSEWKYYLDEAEQEPEVQAQLTEIRKEYATLKPEEIRVIDPCMGSGHILCVLFDVLVRIYEDYGYTAREATVKIVENNLWGLDIDERAAQLAYFAVMMKARQYDRRFFSRGIQPHVYAIEESNGITSAPMHDMGLNLSQEEYGIAAKQALRLVEEMHDAKEYGSIIHVTPCDWDLLRRFAVPRDEDGQLSLDIHGEIEASARLQMLIDIGETLAQKYYAVVTNPPYMGSSGMGDILSKYVKKHYPNSKSDLSTVFMEQSLSMCAHNGMISMINIPVWMFISSFEKLRFDLIENYTFINMIHPGRGIFGSDFGTTSFVLCKTVIYKYISRYHRLFDKQGEVETIEKRQQAFLSGKGLFFAQQDNYTKIPGTPIAYWVGNIFIENIERGIPLRKLARARSGVKTGKNELFIKLWWEVELSQIAFDCSDYEACINSRKRWFPYNKGGEAHNWYGNRGLVVDFYGGGKHIKEYSDRNGTSIDLNAKDVYFNRGITWTALTSSRNTFRYSPKGTVFDSNKGPMIFPENEEQLFYLLALFISPVAQYYFKVFNPTISLQNGDVDNLPIIIDKHFEEIIGLSKLNIELAKNNWDSFETSWEFKKQPLTLGITIEKAFNKWKQEYKQCFKTVKANEERINALLINTYRFTDELISSVNDDDITLHKVNRDSAVRYLISYAIGCMFGRYSLDESGLIYAGGDWDYSKYRTFRPVKDAIIPICDDEYFADDIVGRFVEFVEVVYGKNTLEENLQFIADALGGKGSSREIIRKYFINDFYKDHCKIYQKRPIYWLFDSGKKNGFKCLIYMHRYQPDTIARIRTDYVHEQQSRYRTAIADLEQQINGATTSERVKLKKKLTKLQAQEKELQVYEEKIHHLADQMISIDLDDGVKHNYAIFKDVLAKIK